MQRTILFIGLTREVSFAGLPITYLALLIGVTMMGFIAFGSFVYLFIIGGTGYAALRALAAYDPKIISAILAALKSTSMSHSLFTKEGMTYRA